MIDLEGSSVNTKDQINSAIHKLKVNQSNEQVNEICDK